MRDDRGGNQTGSALKHSIIQHTHLLYGSGWLLWDRQQKLQHIHISLNSRCIQIYIDGSDKKARVYVIPPNPRNREHCGYLTEPSIS